MKKVIIIGGGFAGLSAARALRSSRQRLEVTLIDRKATLDFLPMLPDVVGGRVPSHTIRVSLDDLSRRLNFRFLQDTVRTVDAESNRVVGEKVSLDYDALIVASGSETNFYGNDEARRVGFPLDTCEDADRLRAALESGRFKSCLIVGGGYTGVELAAQIRVGLDKHASVLLPISLIERSSGILRILPVWMQTYAMSNLSRLRVEALTDCSVKTIEDGAIELSNGRTFEKPCLIWTAGVQTADYVRAFHEDKTTQGRVRVNESLQMRDNVFVAGDAASVIHRESPLRMSVQFAITQGRLAGTNCSRRLSGRPMRPYRPFDPGFVLPMANGRSCGTVLGVNLRGSLPTLFHYMMCLLRLPRLRGKLSLLEVLVSRP